MKNCQERRGAKKDYLLIRLNDMKNSIGSVYARLQGRREIFSHVSSSSSSI